MIPLDIEQLQEAVREIAKKMRKYIGHLIYKTVGTLNFIRRIEWRIMLEWLELKEGERILDVACGGGER